MDNELDLTPTDVNAAYRTALNLDGDIDEDALTLDEMLEVLDVPITRSALNQRCARACEIGTMEKVKKWVDGRLRPAYRVIDNGKGIE